MKFSIHTPSAWPIITSHSPFLCLGRLCQLLGALAWLGYPKRAVEGLLIPRDEREKHLCVKKKKWAQKMTNHYYPRWSAGEMNN